VENKETESMKQKRKEKVRLEKKQNREEKLRKLKRKAEV